MKQIVGEKMKIRFFKLNWIEQRNLDFGDSTRVNDMQLSTGVWWHSTADTWIRQDQSCQSVDAII